VKVHYLIVSTLLTITLVFIHSGVLASDFSGPVVSVLDGDSFEVLYNTLNASVSVASIARRNAQSGDHLWWRTEKDVTTFVTRRGWKGKERTGMYGLNGTLQDLGIAN
jgi:hypothetical protein